jgi:hypothetical protein
MDKIEREKIMSAIETINNDKSGGDKEKKYAVKYSWLKDQYPNLYRVACQERIIDSSTLAFMLTMLEKMNEGTTQDDASKEVGQMLFDQYVAPVVTPNTVIEEIPDAVPDTGC